MSDAQHLSTEQLDAGVATVNAVKHERRRGINAMVVRAGIVRQGDPIEKIA